MSPTWHARIRLSYSSLGRRLIRVAFCGEFVSNHDLIRGYSVPSPTIMMCELPRCSFASKTLRRNPIPCGRPKLPPYMNKVLFSGMASLERSVLRSVVDNGGIAIGLTALGQSSTTSGLTSGLLWMTYSQFAGDMQPILSDNL